MTGGWAIQANEHKVGVMRKVLPALFVCVVAWSATAGIHSLPREKPLASIALPDDWKAEEYSEGEGVEAVSADGEVYIAIETTEAEDVEDAMKEAAEYLATKDVVFDESSMKQTQQKINDMEVVNVTWDGEDNDGPAKISLAVVSVTGERGLLFVYWASPDGEKKHQEELNKISQSIRKAD